MEAAKNSFLLKDSFYVKQPSLNDFYHAFWDVCPQKVIHHTCHLPIV